MSAILDHLTAADWVRILGAVVDIVAAIVT